MLASSAPDRRRPQLIAAGLCVALVAACTDYQSQRLDDVGQWPRPSAAAGRPAAAAGASRHLVMPGETLSELAEHYKVPLRRLIDLNRVKKPYKIYVGQVLVVPGAATPAATASAAGRAAGKRVAAVPLPRARPVQMAEASAERLVSAEADVGPVQDEALREATRRAASRQPPALSGDGFLWPVRGRVLDGFGEKPNGARNDGINIAAIEGAPVRAAENGIVVYAGDTIPGFGRMLLIRHAGGFTTAYAHNSAMFVQVGDKVERGQVIAHVGSSGAVAGPQLHFEMRMGRKPVDPSKHLTQDTQVASTQ